MAPPTLVVKNLPNFESNQKINLTAIIILVDDVYDKACLLNFDKMRQRPLLIGDDLKQFGNSD